MTGNNIVKISTSWSCECGTVNPLRYRKCKVCGKEIPFSVREMIYLEELQLQKRNFAEELRQKRILRYQKQQKDLRNKQLVLIILLVIVLGASAVRWAIEGTGLKTIAVRGKTVAAKLQMTGPAESGTEISGEDTRTLMVRLKQIPDRLEEIRDGHNPEKYLEYTLEELTEIAEKFQYLEERWEELMEKEVRMKNVYDRYYQ